MKKVVFITNIPSPYRVDFFVFLQKTYTQYEFHVIFSGGGMENRKWHVELRELKNYRFLKSKTLIIRRRYDDRYVFLPFGVEKELKQIGPDFVFAMEYNPTILRAVHYCRKKKIPFASWTDGTAHSERAIGTVQRLSRKYIIKRADAFVASSTASMKNQISYGADKSKCFLSYLTVDIEKYLMKKDHYMSRQMIYVGSLIERKGLDLLLDALARLPDDITLVIVGEGQEREILQKQAGELGIKDRIRFTGFLEGEELKKLYHESDLFVLPTREDCFGLVILEAMCASLPIVCSKFADGAYDLLKEGENGFLVDPYDAAQFAKIIDRMFTREDLAIMGKKSYERALEFSFANVARGCVESIEFCLHPGLR